MKSYIYMPCPLLTAFNHFCWLAECCDQVSSAAVSV